MKHRKFVDSVQVRFQAGRGGDGAATFHREKFIAYGGPDGGDGGQGGDITLVADPDEDSLVSLYLAPVQKAEDGDPGSTTRKHGRNGQSLILKVPCGTEIRSVPGDELLAELLAPGQEHRVVRGGRGGLGNVHFKSSTHQAPREHTHGKPGEELEARLVVKIVADVGLVGLPNAGKSSLLAAISDAHPRIAAYPFTTVNPLIGTTEFDDYTSLRVADIPGIIAGAHAGAGLGHDFLRHIERTRILALVIDMAGADGRDPVEDYRLLCRELKLYRKDILNRPVIVVANKMDLHEATAHLKVFRRKVRRTIVPISAELRTGIPDLRHILAGLSAEIRQARLHSPGPSRFAERLALRRQAAAQADAGS